MQPKYLINSHNFPWGFVTPDDSWSNRWRDGSNAALGWSPALPGSGSGAKSLGQELEISHGVCQLPGDQGLPAVCFRAPTNAADQATVTTHQRDLHSEQLQTEAGVPAVGCRLPGPVREQPQ